MQRNKDINSFNIINPVSFGTYGVCCFLQITGKLVYSSQKFWNTTDIILFFEEHDSLLCLNNGRFNMFNRNSPEVKALLHKIEDESCPFGDDIGLKILSGGSDHKWLFTAPFGVEQTVFVQDVILRYKESLHK